MIYYEMSQSIRYHESGRGRNGKGLASTSHGGGGRYSKGCDNKGCDSRGHNDRDLEGRGHDSRGATIDSGV